MVESECDHFSCACDVLAIPASSATSERVFKHTSLQVTQKRTRLSEENAKTTSLISINYSRLEAYRSNT